MKNLIILILVAVLGIQSKYVAQNNINAEQTKQILSKTDTSALINIFTDNLLQLKQSKEAAVRYMESKGYVIKKSFPDGSGIEFKEFRDGLPRYISTRNRIAANTISSNKVWGESNLGYNLTGAGINLGIWDEGSPYTGHTSFWETVLGPRHSYYIDTTGSEDPGLGLISDHATHVTGTIVSDGGYEAKGMAEKAVVHSRDWIWDVNEMASAAGGLDNNLPEPLILSNHSYGEPLGWHFTDLKNLGSQAWYWMAAASAYTDNRFSSYEEITKTYDNIAYLAPFYTIVWAAGNDRGEGAEQGATHYHYANGEWISANDNHSKDNGINGYWTMSVEGGAKNIITVGAVDDIPNGYSHANDVKQVNTSFSNWGPTTDGRIKPDIVANGASVYSTLYRDGSGSGNKFGYLSGTSMAAPCVTGSIAQLLQHYKATHNNSLPVSATVKAIIIHTADEAGQYPGPDYQFGWGLMNTYKAAQLISLDQQNPSVIQELTLSNGQSYTINNLYSDGTQPIRITLVWNDPTPQSLPSSPVLVNDLDVRLIKNGSTTYTPWILNPNIPESAATTGDNTRDNVEQIFLQTPGAGYYTVTISPKKNFTQNFSLIMTGFVEPYKTIILKQIGSDDQPFGQAAYWENMMWNYVGPSQPVTLPLLNK